MNKRKNLYSFRSLNMLWANALISVLISISSSYKFCSAQSFTLIKEVKINKAVSLSTDRYSHILVGDTKGNIYKFDSTGNLTHDFSPQHLVAISQLEAWQTLQVFVFYKDIQAFTILNRFMVPLPGYPVQLHHEMIGFVRAATIAADEQVWLFDDRDFSLKKWNIRSQQISLRTPLELILDAAEYQINFMREYQNMLYVNDKNSGILVFDNLGNYKKKLPFPQLNFFSFYNDELYFVQQGKLHFINIYTLAQRDLNLPNKQPIQQAVVAGKILFLLSDTSLLIYKLL